MRTIIVSNEPAGVQGLWPPDQREVHVAVIFVSGAGDEYLVTRQESGVLWSFPAGIGFGIRNDFGSVVSRLASKFGVRCQAVAPLELGSYQEKSGRNVVALAVRVSGQRFQLKGTTWLKLSKKYMLLDAEVPLVVDWYRSKQKQEYPITH